MRLLAILLTVASLPGQSVIKKVLNGQTAPVASAAILNQGQTTHTLYVKYLNSGGSCINVGGTIRIEASYDGTIYFGLTSSPLIMSTDTGEATGYVSVSAGPFPFIRVNQYDVLGSRCLVSAWYSGSVFSVAEPQLAQAITSQWRSSLSAATPSSPATVLVAPPSIDTFRRAVAYAFTITNLAIAPLSVTLQEETPAGACDNVTVVNTFFKFNVFSHQTIVLPGSDVPWFVPSAAGNLICAQLVSASSISYSIKTVYRLEQ